MSRRVRRPPESARSLPSCPWRDLSQSSFPCSRVREQRLPDCFSQVCASSLFLLGKEIVSHNCQRNERFVVVIGETLPQRSFFGRRGQDHFSQFELFKSAAFLPFIASLARSSIVSQGRDLF